MARILKARVLKRQSMYSCVRPAHIVTHTLRAGWFDLEEGKPFQWPYGFSRKNVVLEFEESLGGQGCEKSGVAVKVIRGYAAGDISCAGAMAIIEKAASYYLINQRLVQNCNILIADGSFSKTKPREVYCLIDLQKRIFSRNCFVATACYMVS